MEKKIVFGKFMPYSSQEFENAFYHGLEAYAPTPASQKAIDNGCVTSDKKPFVGNTCISLRNNYIEKRLVRVWIVDYHGGLEWSPHCFTNGCVRGPLHVIYNPELDFNCQPKSLTKTFYDEKIQRRRKGTSVGQIVTCEGKDFLWLNKEACEKGETSLMELDPMVGIDKMVTFNSERIIHNYTTACWTTSDFATADIFREHWEKVMRDYVPESMQKYVVTMQVSSEDGFMKSTPVFEHVFDLFDTFKVLLQSSRELQPNYDATDKLNKLRECLIKYKTQFFASTDFQNIKGADEKALDDEFDMIVSTLYKIYAKENETATESE